jgi:hypothetical protein
MTRRWVETLTVVWLLTGAPAAYAETGPGPVTEAPAAATELDPITVTPQVNPLDESMEKLRAMMEEAPCLGCGPQQEAARKSIYTKTYYGVGAVLSFLSGMPEKPPDPNLEERLEDRVRGDWRQYEREPDR